MDVLRPPAFGTASPGERLAAPSRARGRLRSAAALVALLLLAAGALAYVRARTGTAAAYATAPVVRADLLSAVTATGTVDPQNTVAVGTQESGTVAAIFVDYNAHVRRGQILAKLDPTTFDAALASAQASLAQAQAQADAARATAAGATSGIGTADATQRAAAATAAAAAATAGSQQAAVAGADANVGKSQSALALAQRTVARDATLIGSGYIAQSQLDADRSNLVAAQAALDGARVAARQAVLGAAAGVAQARAAQAQSSAQRYGSATAQSQARTQAADAAAASASVAIAAAQVRQAQLNLQKTIVTSPVDGTVVSRAVSVGTTVAASLQTPTLFSIAQDLSKMEVDLSVGEPDIGNVRPGAAVDFTVLAYPERTFHGTVSQVRINPTTTNNVVTYATVVLVDNRDGNLLPGMTADAAIHVAEAANALVVPVAALAYVPAAGTAGGTHRRHAAGAATAGAAGGVANAAASASPWGATTGGSAAAATAGSRGRIFVQRAGALVRVPVRVELVSGAQAAVAPLRGTLGVGDAVVVGDESAARGASSPRTAGAGPLGGTFAGPGGGAARGLR